MKVVVVGGGAISNHLVSAAPSEISVSCVSIRSLSDESGTWTSVLEDCVSADIVVYLAYHHRDLPKNMRLLGKTLSVLAQSSWRGQFIFFNTQSALATKILKSSRPLRQIFCFDLYTTTKNLQSWLLSRYSKRLNLTEIYLPVVLGFGTKAQKRYEDISKHNIIYLPAAGNNQFAYLNINVFVNWFWRENIGQLGGNMAKQKLCKLFIYQGLSTFADMMRLINSKSSGEGTPLVINDCSYKYRFSNYLKTNLVFSLRMTPVWLILSVLRNELRKLRSSEWVADKKTEEATVIGTTFYAVGPEYQFFCATIDLAAVPFDKILIES